jgi:hypothetical protein
MFYFRIRINPDYKADMKNVFILGFGRSGTSLMGGILFHSGYFLGDDLYPPRESNPMGFFENERINTINEKILEQYDYIKLHPEKQNDHRCQSPFNPGFGQRWLSYIENETVIQSHDQQIQIEIQSLISEDKFAFKDPRFSFTLPVWKPYLPKEIVLICMFRQPDVTTESVIKDCMSANYLQNFIIDRNIIFQLWANCYRRILKYLQYYPQTTIVFVHYEQLLSLKAISKLSEILGVQLKSNFISPELNRTKPGNNMPGYSKALYDLLCTHADFH